MICLSNKEGSVERKERIVTRLLSAIVPNLLHKVNFSGNIYNVPWILNLAPHPKKHKGYLSVWIDTISIYTFWNPLFAEISLCQTKKQKRDSQLYLEGKML